MRPCLVWKMQPSATSIMSRHWVLRDVFLRRQIHCSLCWKRWATLSKKTQLTYYTKTVTYPALAELVGTHQQRGQEQFQSFKEGMGIEGESTFYKSIKGNTVAFFKLEQAASSSKEKVLKDNCQLFSQLFISRQTRQYDFQEFVLPLLVTVARECGIHARSPWDSSSTCDFGRQGATGFSLNQYHTSTKLKNIWWLCQRIHSSKDYSKECLWCQIWACWRSISRLQEAQPGLKSLRKGDQGSGEEWQKPARHLRIGEAFCRMKTTRLNRFMLLKINCVKPRQQAWLLWQKRIPSVTRWCHWML